MRAGGCGRKHSRDDLGKVKRSATDNTAREETKLCSLRTSGLGTGAFPFTSPLNPSTVSQQCRSLASLARPHHISFVTLCGVCECVQLGLCARCTQDASCFVLKGSSKLLRRQSSTWPHGGGDASTMTAVNGSSGGGRASHASPKESTLKPELKSQHGTWKPRPHHKPGPPVGPPVGPRSLVVVAATVAQGRRRSAVQWRDPRRGEGAVTTRTRSWKRIRAATLLDFYSDRKRPLGESVQAGTPATRTCVQALVPVIWLLYSAVSMRRM